MNEKVMSIGDRTNCVGDRFRSAEVEPTSPTEQILVEASRSTALAWEEVFSLRQELASAREPERQRIAPEVQALQLQLVTLQTQLASANQALSEVYLHRQLVHERARADQLQRYIDEILSSTSWRITRPMRMVKDMILSLRRR